MNSKETLERRELPLTDLFEVTGARNNGYSGQLVAMGYEGAFLVLRGRGPPTTGRIS